MADIQPYTSRVIAQGAGMPASATADAFGAPASKAMGDVAFAALDVAKVMHEQQLHEDNTNIQLGMSKARAHWTQQLFQRSQQAQPGDQTFLPTLMEDMSKYFDEQSSIAKTAKGQQFYRERAAEIQNDFLGRGIHEQSRLSGEGAKLNMAQMQESSGQTVMADATQRDAVLKQIQDYTASIPGIDQATRIELQRKSELYVNHAAVLGQIQRNPDELLARINPKDLDNKDPTRQMRTGDAAFDALPAEQQYKLVTQAREYSNAYRTDDERKRVQAEREKRDAEEATIKGYVTRILSPGGTNGKAPTAREIAADPMVTGEKAAWLTGLQLQRQRELEDRSMNRPHPENVRDFLGQIRAAADDPKKLYDDKPIFDAYMKGKLNANELDYLTSRVNGLKDPTTNPFMKRIGTMESQVWRAIQANPMIAGQEATSPGTSAAIAQQFSLMVDQKIKALRAENKDPSVLLDPESKDYVMRPGFLSPFISAAQGAPAPVAGATQRGAPAALPTYKEYDKLPKGARFTDPSGKERIKP